MATVLVNGILRHSIDVLDRGLQYGDGLFETIAIKAGVPELWTTHIDRLREGCRRLALAMPDDQLLRKEVGQVCGDGRAVAKVILTRGAGGRGYRAPCTASPTRIVYSSPWPDYPGEWSRSGVKVRLCRTPLGINPLLAGIKHLNRLEQVLARSEWDDGDTAEGLMCDVEGFVVEGTMSNLFCVTEGRLVTPPVDRAGVAGVMRRCVMEAAAELGIPTDVAPLEPARLFRASELFLTNSLIRIWPIRELDARVFTPGPVTRRLQEAVENRILAL